MDIVLCQHARVATVSNTKYCIPLEDQDKAMITFLKGHPNRSHSDKNKTKKSLKETVHRYETALKELRENHNPRETSNYGEAQFNQFQYAIDFAKNYYNY